MRGADRRRPHRLRRRRRRCRRRRRRPGRGARPVGDPRHRRRPVRRRAHGRRKCVDVYHRVLAGLRSAWTVSRIGVATTGGVASNIQRIAASTDDRIRHSFSGKVDLHRGRAPPATVSSSRALRATQMRGVLTTWTTTLRKPPPSGSATSSIRWRSTGMTPEQQLPDRREGTSRAHGSACRRGHRPLGRSPGRPSASALPGSMPPWSKGPPLLPARSACSATSTVSRIAPSWQGTSRLRRPSEVDDARRQAAAAAGPGLVHVG